MITFIMKVWVPLIGLIMSTAMAGLYITSIYGQAGPDYADSRYPSPSPWYLRLSCDAVERYGATKDCMMAKGTFAVTVYMLYVLIFREALDECDFNCSISSAIYLANFGLALWSMLPNKKASSEEEDVDENSSSGPPTTDKQWEMAPVTPRTTATPFTPRTQAFHTLDRKLPLRYS